MLIGNKDIAVAGKLLKIARFREEWFEDIEDPPLLIKGLKDSKESPDIFTFWQRLPETKPKYNYYMEWNPVAVIPITSFTHWYEKQINTGARRAIRKAEKKGVQVRVVNFSDELLNEIICIIKETPVRQGRQFSQYERGHERLKCELSKDLDRCDFIGAYYEDELIGYIKLAFAGQYAVPFGMVSKVQHRDKSSQNALLAKAVKLCEEKGVPYLLYGNWSRGTLGDFKRHNGCKMVNLPRYFIPLSLKGRLALGLRLHHGVAGILPEKLIQNLTKLRWRWHMKKPPMKT